jgi:DNA-binding NarL/FixJ family response regulator
MPSRVQMTEGDLMIPPDTDQQLIRILIADNQLLVRHALITILSLESDMIVVAEAADGNEALRLARLWKPDVVLMDLQIPRLDDCTTIQRIVAECPGTQVVVLTRLDADELLFEAISSGAQAYLLKDASEDEIHNAIRGVMRQESWLAPKVVRKILNEFRRIRPVMDKLPSEPLTSREAQILDLVIQGRINKEIAATIFLAEGTVKNYVSRIMGKLNVRTRTELAVKGLCHLGRTTNAPLQHARHDRLPFASHSRQRSRGSRSITERIEVGRVRSNAPKSTGTDWGAPTTPT